MLKILFNTVCSLYLRNDFWQILSQRDVIACYRGFAENDQIKVNFPNSAQIYKKMLKYCLASGRLLPLGN